VRHWLLAIGIGLAACAPVRAGSASANLAVSVTVMDQCLIQAASRSARCAGNTAYAVAEVRERIAPISDRLTTATEHAHTPDDGPRLGTSLSVAGDGSGRDGARLADAGTRMVSQVSEPIDAIRVTYSF
jgi:hypothetical protein